MDIVSQLFKDQNHTIQETREFFQLFRDSRQFERELLNRTNNHIYKMEDQVKKFPGFFTAGRLHEVSLEENHP